MSGALTRYAALALLAASTGCGANAPRRSALYGAGAARDARVETRVADIEARRVLDAVLPQRLGDAARCPAAGAGLDDARAAGAVTPSVLAAVTGAFTRAGAAERAYVVGVGECNTSRAQGLDGSIRVVVMRDGRVVANHEAPGESRLERVVDVDADGVSELLLVAGHTGQGETVEVARLVRVGASALEVVRDFGEVARDVCGTESNRATRTTATVTATRDGAGVRYAVERSTQPCAAAP